jgi:hypothetical protein
MHESQIQLLYVFSKITYYVNNLYIQLLLLAYLTIFLNLKSHITSYGRIIASEVLRRICKEIAMVQFKALLKHSPGGTDENYKIKPKP